jgi:hypothetical protein
MTGTLVITGNSSAGFWNITGPGFYESGTYTMNGTTAILYSSGVPIGTAGLISSNTLVITLNAISGSPGTYTATRYGSGGPSSGADFTGSWIGTVGSHAGFLDIDPSGTWSISVMGIGYNEYESGTYITSGSTATLRNGGGTVTGTAALLNATTLQLTLHVSIGTDSPGTYNFIWGSSS